MTCNFSMTPFYSWDNSLLFSMAFGTLHPLLTLELTTPCLTFFVPALLKASLYPECIISSLSLEIVFIIPLPETLFLNIFFLLIY